MDKRERKKAYKDMIKQINNTSSGMNKSTFMADELAELKKQEEIETKAKIRVEEDLKNAKKYEKLLDFDMAITMRKQAIDEMSYSPFFGEELILELRLKNAKDYEKLLAYDKAIETYNEAYDDTIHESGLRSTSRSLFTQVDRITRLINRDNVKHLDFGAWDDDEGNTLHIWYRLGMDDDAINIAELLVEKKQFEKAIKIYETFDKDNIVKIRKLIADDKVKHLDYDKAIEIYENIGDKETAKNVRKLKAEQGAVKVDQTVVQGDQITKTEIKDSVLNRSNIGSGKSKAEEIKEIKDLLDSGAIDDDEFKQMKKEILGK